MKDLLQDIRRNTSGSYEAAGVARLSQTRAPGPDLADSRSGDDMLRALDRQLHAGLDQSNGLDTPAGHHASRTATVNHDPDALQPEVVEPGDKSA